eukprot:TRINITY_DN3077_c0_g1_i1.p1 TRINITY_DN3077_c0_g1~~TRINITY_DN3077_c0_g1_i1.p1  ORF type:complete len:203 (-),score=47.75 TRINITY_DN3077_c0_g1_i1:91-699(-)
MRMEECLVGSDTFPTQLFLLIHTLKARRFFFLDGIFTDHQGDHKAGTYLLNPEGFEHAPSSKDGCLIFVRLRQYPGLGRPQLALPSLPISHDSDNFSDWVKVENVSKGEIYRKYLFNHPEQWPDSSYLERWTAGTEQGQVVCPKDGREILVISGDWSDELGTHSNYSWIRLPSSFQHSPFSKSGCILFIKDNHLPFAVPLNE